MKKNFPVTGKERAFGADGNILSTTDLKGAITYVNDEFIAISGFTEQELLLQNHNIVRHPDMPPAAFADLWATVKAGRSWMGIVKNRCKNGDHYWVDAFVTPILEKGKVVEYQSVRTKPSSQHVAAAERLYPLLMQGKLPGALRLPSPGLRMKLAAALAGSLGMGLAAALVFGELSAATAAAVFAGAFLPGLLLLHLLVRPLDELVTRARSVVDNPLTQYVYTGRNDEFGQIAVAMKMLESEAGAIAGRIGDSSRHLSANAEGLARVVEQSSEGMRRQQVETDQVATAINQMSASVHEVARNAEYAAEAAGKADSEARTGKRVVDETTAAIRTLADEVEHAAEVIHQLEARSVEITTVLDVIRGIAEQTNLLALNAAIEAARAGEQGRGFAVVADEVRTLAMRTQQSTREIQSMIQTLQEGAKEAVEVMGRSRDQAERSVQQARIANEALEAITRAVTTINDMSAQIATAVEQQSAVSEEINRSVTAIRHASDAAVEAADDSEQAGRNVAALAGDLQQLVRQFWDKRKNRK